MWKETILDSYFFKKESKFFWPNLTVAILLDPLAQEKKNLWEKRGFLGIMQFSFFPSCKLYISFLYLQRYFFIC